MAAATSRSASAAILGARDRAILRRASRIIGVDEVGRGSIAGPVVVCAAAFGTIPRSDRIADSKLLSKAKRETAAVWLRQQTSSWVITEVWPEIIDRVNILEATRLAMAASIRILATPESEAVVDYVTVENVGIPVHSPQGADRDFFSVAAASILAKVHRDRVMMDLGRRDDRWDWFHNMGYGTEKHRVGIGRYGRSYLHRQSFRLLPVLP
jgi:ribonuclease HII